MFGQVEVAAWVPIVAVIIGAGGIGSAIIALRKSGPEVAQITVSAAQGVVVMQSQLIEDQAKRLDVLERERDKCMEAIESARATAELAEAKVETLTKENAELQERMHAMELRMDDPDDVAGHRWGRR